MRKDNGAMSDLALAEFEFMQKNELNALRKVIDDLSPGSVCVNIGAGKGISGSAFIESDTVGKLYTVDIFENAGQNWVGNLENEIILFSRFGYDKDPRYTQILGDSTNIGKTWNREKIDMLFLDADHSYAHTYMNILMWLPHIKQGGIFSFHDFHEPLYPGVEQAATELLVNKYEMISFDPTFAAFRIR
jgi:predicted O-methyltransferase YrrM